MSDSKYPKWTVCKYLPNHPFTTLVCKDYVTADKAYNVASQMSEGGYVFLCHRVSPCNSRVIKSTMKQENL